MKMGKIILTWFGVAVFATAPVVVVERVAAKPSGGPLEAVISISPVADAVTIGYDDTVEIMSVLPRFARQSPALSGVAALQEEFADGMDIAPVDLAAKVDEIIKAKQFPEGPVSLLF